MISYYCRQQDTYKRRRNNMYIYTKQKEKEIKKVYIYIHAYIHYSPLLYTQCSLLFYNNSLPISLRIRLLSLSFAGCLANASFPSLPVSPCTSLVCGFKSTFAHRLSVCPARGSCDNLPTYLPTYLPTLHTSI